MDNAIVKRVESKDKSFYADVKVLSALELLDLDLGEGEQSNSFISAVEVAASVVNWNGEGQVNSLQLLADRRRHKHIHQILRVLDKERGDLPELTVFEYEDKFVLKNESFYIHMKPLTVLELMDLISTVKRRNFGELPSETKLQIVSKIVTDWNGEGILSPTQLREKREFHSYVITLDDALNKFFLSEELTVSESNGLLVSSNDNGRHGDSEPVTMESSNRNGARISFDVERVSTS